MHAALAGLVGPVPHQPDRLAHRLGDLRGLDGGVAEELVPEGAAAGDDVDLDPVLRQAQGLGDVLLGDDRHLQAGPDRGLVGADVGDRAVRLEGRAAAEHEREALLDGLGQQRHVGHGERQLGLAEPGQDRRVGLALDACRGFQVTLIARIASMHWPNVSARTATPVSTSATSVTPGIARTAGRVVERRGASR